MYKDDYYPLCDEFNEDGGSVEETPSVNELYDEGQQEAADAQAEALSWAEDQGMDEWSNGDPIQHSEGYESPKDSENSDDFANDSVLDESQQETTDTDDTTQQEIDDENMENEEELDEQEPLEEEKQKPAEEKELEEQQRQEEELTEQQRHEKEAKEQAEREEQERLDSLSEEELINERTARENQQASAREYYDKLGGQIADIQQNKNLYSEEEYNSYFDEKAKAQADTSNRINELQGEINQYNDRLNRLRK